MNEVGAHPKEQGAYGSGFADPVLDAQFTFRRIMAAMSEPGTIVTLQSVDGSPRPLSVALVTLALTLCDYETPVWLDPMMRAAPGVAEFLRFHTGAKVIERPGEAVFAFGGGAGELPDLNEFAIGTLEYPDRSTTVVIEVTRLANEAGWRLTGPGIASEAQLAAAPLPDSFANQLRANHALFPRGVDIVLCSGRRLAALPRSTWVER